MKALEPSLLAQKFSRKNMHEPGLRSSFNTWKFNSHECLHVWTQLFDIVGVSGGAFWIKIGADQAETILNLPIYPRTIDSYKSTQNIAREHFWADRKENKTPQLFNFVRMFRT